ncbi:hypothetical protein [Acinetobacter sp. MD2(2019)]|uniref:hypothetical protein n=1 Tax=Acinetobacter sp. MD2(2019) TaxID=2605273 RepID=UPI002D1EC54A|nr:hypothetical protein [Acinetobacter sp. MD2(2019)]MEB3755087.1 hypothetical protein [Acinetobacter sp. MD2(2019)]
MNDINIAISGLSLQSSNELKSALRLNIPNNYVLHWINIADPNIDLLVINESFFDTSNIQRILGKKNCPFLKITKKNNMYGNIHDDTLCLPLNNRFDPLKDWIERTILSKFTKKIIPNVNIEKQQPTAPTTINLNTFKNMYHAENTRLHLFDDTGTLAIIDLRRKIAWAISENNQIKINQNFRYELAKMNDIAKVSRKHEYLLDDWIWNLIWRSPELNYLGHEIEYYQLDHWPQPFTKTDQKLIFQLSASFIHGASLHEIAQKFDLPLATVQQFIAASMASNNGKQIPHKPIQHAKSETKKVEAQVEQSFLNSFFGKLRRRFGL